METTRERRKEMNKKNTKILKNSILML
jgi:hypothetical protein